MTQKRRPRHDDFSAEAPLEVEITAIGAHGDGLATLDGEPLFVPCTTAGDRVRVQRTAADRATVLAWLHRGPHRAEPPCPHFGPGKCGGCALQHLDDSAYAGWKSELAATALARAGFRDVAMRPLARTPPGARRRAEFVAMVTRQEVVIGFHARASHTIVQIGPCPILTPPLVAILLPLKAFLERALRPPATLEILATGTDGGLELVFTSKLAPNRSLRERLGDFAQTADLARIAWRKDKAASPEIMIQRRPVQAMFGQVPVELPPAAFLQASAEGEQAILGAVADAIGPAKRVADLYAGCGAIALALAEDRRVHAVEAADEMTRALEAAARRGGLGTQVHAETRDLVRRPLLGAELAGFDAVIFDPPREGAAAQAQALAASKVPVVVAVSCNPATFARDARTLAQGGYRLTAVTPIDQFLWSPHLELVGAFRR